MIRTSLVVCVFREYEVLRRLLDEAKGFFDDLVVIHDGPELIQAGADGVVELSTEVPAIDFAESDPSNTFQYRQPALPPRPGSIHELVLNHGGRFFEGPRCFQQEPHWPFAWSQARHDWVYRWDADEFPSSAMKEWLQHFRAGGEPPAEISGYTCIWPLWNGQRAITHRWPGGRIFLLHRQRVRFFGMAEQVPVPDGRYESLSFTIRHEPKRKSYGIRNILLRRQGGIWREVIAKSLLRTPLNLPRWRWRDEAWPKIWSDLRGRSWAAMLYFLARETAATIRDQWRTERLIKPLMAVACPLQHLLITSRYRHLRQESRSGTEGQQTP